MDEDSKFTRTRVNFLDIRNLWFSGRDEKIKTNIKNNNRPLVRSPTQVTSLKYK
jgi:hypothetical protein